MSKELSTLTKAEAESLAKQEQIVQDGALSFVAVGNALATIRDEKLHRATHANFKDYIRERWQMDGSHAFRLIEAAEVVKTSPMGDSVKSERVARELGRVPPSQHKKVLMAAAADGGAVTAASVRSAISELPVMGGKNGEAPSPPPMVAGRIKQGREKLGPKVLKELRAAFGKVVRLCDKAGIGDEKPIAAALETIAARIKADAKKGS